MLLTAVAHFGFPERDLLFAFFGLGSPYIEIAQNTINLVRWTKPSNMVEGDALRVVGAVAK